MSELPIGWMHFSLQTLAGANGLVTDGDWVESKDQDPSGDVRLIQLADVGVNIFRNRSERFLTSEKACELRCSFLEKGDVLIARMPDPIGRACVFPGVGQRAVTVVDVMLWRSDRIIGEPRWLAWMMNSLEVRQYIQDASSGTTRQRISGGRLKVLELPTPPLAEQRRIVAKLDALDASAKRARADLDRIPTLVARAKQAILGEVFRQASKSAKELVAIEELVRQDAPICYGVVQPGDDKERGVPLVRVCDLDQGRVDWTAIRTVTPEIAAQYDRSRIKDGDVLVSVVGTIGRVAVAREVPPNCNIARAVARIRPKSERASSEWLSIALQAPQVQERFMADSREVARKTLNISLLKEVQIPDISIELQAEIVRRIETAFAKIDRIAAEAASARALLDRLDQAILAKAFRGELVPQDPNDEPAEKLLEKIKAARVAPPARKARKKQS